MTELTYCVSAGSPAAVLVEVTINAADGSDDGGADAQWVGRRLTGTLSLASHVLKKTKNICLTCPKLLRATSIYRATAHGIAWVKVALAIGATDRV